MLICHCLALTDRDIRATVAQGGTREDLARAAGSACGGCRSQVELIVRGCSSASDDRVGQPARAAI